MCICMAVSIHQKHDSASTPLHSIVALHTHPHEHNVLLVRNPKLECAYDEHFKVCHMLQAHDDPSWLFGHAVIIRFLGSCRMHLYIGNLTMTSCLSEKQSLIYMTR